MTQILAVGGAFSIVSGGNILRMFLIVCAALGMLLPLLFSLEAGLLMMIVFEPFRGVLRRAQYLIVPYSQFEPIHLITPLVSGCAFLLILAREKLEMFRATPLAGAVSVLALICFLQIFNPLQGSLFIGFTGALFYLVPMTWFYFGQTAADDFFPRVLRFIVVIGIISSLYGVYQISIGYPSFELYWLENTDKYSSVAVYNVTRALATFSNSEEWGRYVQIGCLTAFGLAIQKSEGSKRAGWLAAALILGGMIALTGQRTSVFGVFLGLAVLLVTGSRTFGNAVLRIMLISLPLILILGFSNALSEDDIYDLGDDNGVSTILSHTSKGTMDPTGEGSLNVRFERWTYLVTETLPRNPLGSGLGAKSISASREADLTGSAVDNHFLSLALSAGVPATLLLLWILFRATRICVKRLRQSRPGSDEFVMWRIALALLSTYILNNFFGTTFVIYSAAPIGWLLLGWISRQDRVEDEEDGEPEDHGTDPVH